MVEPSTAQQMCSCSIVYVRPVFAPNCPNRSVILFEQRSLRIVAADFFWDSRCLLPLETWFVIRFVLDDFDAVSNYK